MNASRAPAHFALSGHDAMSCDSCQHHQPPTRDGAVPTCAKAGPPNACVLAAERALREHQHRTGRHAERCPRWERR